MDFSKYVVTMLLFISGYILDTHGQENAGMRIPESLRECYRNSNLYSRDKRLPMTMTTLIELIRKVELYEGSYFDLRGLTIALLHRFRMDGIERIPDIAASPGVVPFRPAGGQFPKHRILLKNLIPGNAYTFPNQSLTDQELCTLHFMLSSGVEPWERGNEETVCPYNLHGDQSGYSINSWHYKRVLIRDPDYPLISIQGAQVSQCPIEDGVVYTPQWGTISPGVVLAAMAAALEPQNVPITLILKEPDPVNDTEEKVEKFERYKVMSLTAVLDNIWASTLAGDLAEVAVFQGPRVQGEMYIGPAGEWNDTSIPHSYYMDQRNNGLWQMTDAEGRGGIDGLILASMVQSWEEQMHSLRLSVLLEMYYSDRGVSFNPEYRACERQARYSNVITESNVLESQTMNFARVLSYNSLDAVQISDEKLEEFSKNAVRAFGNHLSNLMSGLYCETSKPHPRVHLNVIIDGTWTTDEAIRVLAQIAEHNDVSHYGSSMAVMNGQDGSWILEKSYSTSSLYKFSENATDNSSTVTWPTSLNLKLSMLNLYNHLGNKTGEERRMKIIGDLSHVILVLGYSATISNEDITACTEIITNSKTNMPDVRFVYVTSQINQNRFKELSTIDPQYPDKVVTLTDKNVETIVYNIVDIISTVPSRLMTAHCENSDVFRKEFEDYITPGHSRTYRIHPLFLLDTEKISIKIRGSGYGDMNICISREELLVGTNCRELTDLEEITIDVTSPCLNYLQQCPPLFLTISVTTSRNRCSEDDCRFPDQVRFLLSHEGMRCTKNPDSNGSSRATNLSLNMVVQVIIVLFTAITFKSI